METKGAAVGQKVNTNRELSWREISLPGAYLCKETGTLYRVEREIAHTGLIVEGVFNGREQRFVMLSPKWVAPAVELRHIAEESNLKFNF